MHDLIAVLDGTHRTVADGNLNDKSGHVVELRRDLRAAPADAWSACTDPERVRRWFLPLEGDLRAGGTYQLEGNAGGTIMACDAPHHLELSWEFGDLDPARVTLDLESAGDENTTLVLRHLVPDDEHWATYGPGAVGVGWDGSLTALAVYVSTGSAPSPDEVEPAFYRRSAVAWGAAHRAAGADGTDADRRAGATADFYAPASSQS